MSPVQKKPQLPLQEAKVDQERQHLAPTLTSSTINHSRNFLWISIKTMLQPLTQQKNTRLITSQIHCAKFKLFKFIIPRLWSWSSQEKSTWNQILIPKCIICCIEFWFEKSQKFVDYVGFVVIVFGIGVLLLLLIVLIFCNHQKYK